MQWEMCSERYVAYYSCFRGLNPNVCVSPRFVYTFVCMFSMYE